jgi:hypothetical protein
MRSGGRGQVVVGAKWSCGRTQTMRSFGSTSLLSRMALRTAEPSLPVALVSASLPILLVYVGLGVHLLGCCGRHEHKMCVRIMTSFLSREPDRGSCKVKSDMRCGDFVSDHIDDADQKQRAPYAPGMSKYKSVLRVVLGFQG